MFWYDIDFDSSYNTGKKNPEKLIALFLISLTSYVAFKLIPLMDTCCIVFVQAEALKKQGKCTNITTD